MYNLYPPLGNVSLRLATTFQGKYVANNPRPSVAPQSIRAVLKKQAPTVPGSAGDGEGEGHERAGSGIVDYRVSAGRHPVAALVEQIPEGHT